MRKDIATQINEAHESAVRHAGQAIEYARECGDLLIQAKERAEHGEWLPWLREHCTVGERQAQKYMKLAKLWPEIEAKTNRDSDLSIREALALLDDDAQKARDLASEAAAIERELQQLSRDLDAANTIDGVTHIRDRATELETRAFNNRMRATRELGEVLARCK